MDAYDAQVGQWRQIRTEKGYVALRDFLALEYGWLGSDREPDAEQSAQLDRDTPILRDLEERKLLIADPIFVSGDLCAVVDAASRTFTPEPFEPEDFITPAGFLVFEQPVEMIAGAEGDQVRLDFRAFSWMTIQTERVERPMVALTTYVRWEMIAPSILAWDRMVPISFGDKPDRADAYWWRIAQTTLRLMQEWRPASRYHERPDRPTRRSAARLGFTDRDVVVVRLRRERSPSETLGGVANYSHRFLVSGHWRNQWHPSTGTHRQQWISPYVKGPDDKPLKTPAGRAFVLTR
jgi:hypothetical protein